MAEPTTKEGSVIVDLISSEGLVLIGPGSEWFWTALSGLVLALTFIAIYRQLRLQSNERAVAQVEVLTGETGSERHMRNALEVLIAVGKGNSTADLPEAAAGAVANHYERVGALARSSRIDRTLFWQLDSSFPQIWWAILGPWVAMSRTRSANPTACENFEWLAATMHDMDLRSGRVPPDESFISGSIGRWTRVFEDNIRTEKSLRTVIVAPTDRATSEPSGPAEAEFAVAETVNPSGVLRSRKP